MAGDPRPVAWCLVMISLLTHNPRPVPVASLVVKNGSKIRRRMAPRHATAIIGNKRRTPGVPSTHDRERRTDICVTAPLAHRVNGIADQISEKLAQLPGKAVQIQVRPTAYEKPLSAVSATVLGKEACNRVQQLTHVGNHWQRRLAVKTQGLLRHLCNAGNFLLRKVCITHRLPIQRRLMP